MSTLTLHNVSQSFGAFDVFTGITARIEPDSRIGLVGPNGIGKTTLLRLIAGSSQPTTGTISLHSSTRIGYLHQEAMEAFTQTTRTLHEEMLLLYANVGAMESEMRALEQQMAEAPSDEIFERYSELQEYFEHIGGYDYELRIEQTLSGLGFKPEHYTLPLMHLSGGQKTRALLARLLLERPNLLILDEPTNHLDIRAVQWLEKTLANWKGALLIVSHDRFFLDHVVNTIWELGRAGLHAFRGNYTAYIQQRDAKRAAEMTAYEREMERLREELDYIKRNIARASTNGMAVGRLRRLSRDLVAIEELGLIDYKKAKSWSETGVGGVRPYTVMEAEAAIKAIPPPHTPNARLHMSLNSSRLSAEKVLSGRDLVIGYPNTPLFSTGEFSLHRGEIAAMLGSNGTGKTTFLKTLMGEIAPLAGKIHLGINVKVGYFAQAHDSFDPDKSVIDTLIEHAESIGKRMTPGEARKYLALYLFRGEDVFKQVSMLSGGERGRLALASLSLHGANVLLLDEPTNHLDIAAQEVLQEVLENFEGTILMVSHDRYLIDRLATQIWSLQETGDAEFTLHVFKGTYEEYLANQSTEKAEAKETRAAEKRAVQAGRVTDKRKSESVRHLESQIHMLEGALRELETVLEKASNAGRMEDVARLGEQYASTQARLEMLVADWANMAETT